MQLPGGLIPSAHLSALHGADPKMPTFLQSTWTPWSPCLEENRNVQEGFGGLQHGTMAASCSVQGHMAGSLPRPLGDNRVAQPKGKSLTKL